MNPAPHVLKPMGGDLGIDLQKKKIRCKKCGYVLSMLGENPKKGARVREQPLKKGRWPDGSMLVKREYICPGCGVLFDVTIEEKEFAGPLFDIELDLNGLQAPL